MQYFSIQVVINKCQNCRQRSREG